MTTAESVQGSVDSPLENVNVLDRKPLPTPSELKAELPASPATSEFVATARRTVQNILDKRDKRLLVVVGPCSIHDLDSAREYAAKLKPLADALSDQLYLVMRVYFEKPRTTVGWKGLINDPNLNDSFELDEGLRRARGLLLELAEMGLPSATEALDTTVPQYIGDLITWTAIGARTTESQSHRELASGLSTPVGFKNGTEGQIDVAINAMQSARESHHFMGISNTGVMSVFQTRGNAYGHVVLRGGKTPNFDPDSIRECEEQLTRAGLSPAIVVDCSHGNSSKDHAKQPAVAKSCIEQILAGTTSILGLMIESHLVAGRQSPVKGEPLTYGQSITDACLGWNDTEELLTACCNQLRQRASG